MVNVCQQYIGPTLSQVTGKWHYIMARSPPVQIDNIDACRDLIYQFTS
jgi:hypothetical protein